MKHECLPLGGGIEDRVSALETKTSSSFVGSATGVIAVPISNIGDYTSLTVIILYEWNSTIFTLSINIPKAFIDTLTMGTYRFFRTGDNYSNFVVGVTSSLVILNTANIFDTDILNTTSIYVYKN